MPDNKSQHYVPRAHLRPFCMDDAGAAINLLNIDAMSFVQNAPTKGQCARSYFYGKDGAIEKALQGPEGRYASIVRQATAAPESLGSAELAELLDFTLLQTLRSFGYIEKLAAQIAEFDVGLSGPQGAMPEGWEKLTHADLIEMSVRNFLRVRPHVRDLDACLIFNKSGVEFVTSDDPAVQTNRYLSQRVRGESGGFGNSGLMLCLPLSPTLLFLAFDPFVYFAPHRVGHVVVITRERDASELNQLQFLHARRNVYFRDWSSRSVVAKAYKDVEPTRPKTWHKIVHYGVVSKKNGATTYGEISEDQAKVPGKFLVRTTGVQVVPNTWPGVLKVRLRPKVVDTGTGTGIVRPGHQLLKKTFDDFVSDVTMSMEA